MSWRPSTFLIYADVVPCLPSHVMKREAREREKNKQWVLPPSTYACYSVPTPILHSPSEKKGMLCMPFGENSLTTAIFMACFWLCQKKKEGKERRREEERRDWRGSWCVLLPSFYISYIMAVEWLGLGRGFTHAGGDCWVCWKTPGIPKSSLTLSPNLWKELLYFIHSLNWQLWKIHVGWTWCLQYFVAWHVGMLIISWKKKTDLTYL